MMKAHFCPFQKKRSNAISYNVLSRFRIFCRGQKNSLPYPVGDEHSSVPLMTCVMYAKLSNFIAFEIGEHVLFLSFFECFRVFSLRYHVISRAG